MHAFETKTKKKPFFYAFITTLTAVEASATEGRPKSEQQKNKPREPKTREVRARELLTTRWRWRA